MISELTFAPADEQNAPPYFSGSPPFPIGFLHGGQRAPLFPRPFMLAFFFKTEASAGFLTGSLFFYRLAKPTPALSDRVVFPPL